MRDDDDLELTLPGGDPPDAKAEAFYRWIGVCIKEWADVEAELFKLCGFALKADRRQVATVFYRTPTIDSRLMLVDELLLNLLPQREKNSGRAHPDVTRWIKLRTTVKALLPVRNFLAHAPVETRIFLRFGYEDKVTASQSWLQVATSANERLRGRPKKSATNDDLEAHFKQVQAVVSELRAYLDHLAGAQPAAPAQHSTRQNQD
jgi:hypothetical protein